jgi:Anti-sigma-K factor rskA, C-terminal
MTTHEWFIEHRTAFLIRSLEPDEDRSFREHLTGCAECRAEVERIEHELAWLPMGARPATPRPGLTRALVDGAIGGRPRASRWLVPVGMAAAVLVAVGSFGWARRSIDLARAEFRRERADLLEELAMARDTLGIIQTAAKVRHASITMGKQQGGLVIFADDRTHRWNVVVYGLPAPAPGQVCQFWFITETGMVRGVQVQTHPGGPAFMTLPMPPTGGTVMGAALTIEPAGSNLDRPQGTELAHLMM